MTTSEQIHKLRIGAAQRCPNCERGSLFSGILRLHPTCPVCGVRFERSSGESLGGMMLNLVAAELLTFGGFFGSYFLLGRPADMTPLIVFWLVFDIVFVLGFYRPARGLWIAVTYLTSGLHVDEGDTEKAARP
jgi:uncharacterized protein (DUF983 family)